ncbi:EscU/YscU/HrcU family type III secretion system export apparatus switch protein [Paraburkholderia sacchari]|uniref:EscU/YscU/HrcU family type III secretion system export apparatus switch protein n=1 Tax=Paraburkholderia sacchari TaxID=159450 RepID=UPI001BCCCBE5|nr:EscU/YscU/HrcU family type III secretion system export apparatus switch protein [Paraburkholderia sacchari]
MSDKTEKATPRRLQRARRDGDIAKSVHLSTAISSLLWWLLLAFEAPVLFGACVRATGAILSLDATRPFDWQLKAALEALSEPGRAALVMTAMSAMAVIVPELAQTRGLIALKRIEPDFKRLNPVEGFKNLFGLKMVFDTGVSLVQFAILIFIAWRSIANWIGLATPAYSLSPLAQLGLATDACMHLLGLVALSQIAPAAGDYALQRVLRNRRLRMDKEELKREFRDENGDPHAKGRRRALHRQLNR